MRTEQAWEVVSRPLPRSTYAHARRRAMTARVMVILAALAIVSGALIAVIPIYEGLK